MDGQAQAIRDLLDRVRGRWRRTTLFRAIVRAGLAVASVFAATLLLALLLRLAGRAPAISAMAPPALAVLGLAAIILAIGAAVWALWPTRRVPSDQRVAQASVERSVPRDERRRPEPADVRCAESRTVGILMAASGTDQGHRGRADYIGACGPQVD